MSYYNPIHDYPAMDIENLFRWYYFYLNDLKERPQFAMECEYNEEIAVLEAELCKRHIPIFRNNGHIIGVANKIRIDYLGAVTHLTIPITLIVKVLVDNKRIAFIGIGGLNWCINFDEIQHFTYNLKEKEAKIQGSELSNPYIYYETLDKLGLDTELVVRINRSDLHAKPKKV